jgi:CBS domain-containing protein
MADLQGAGNDPDRTAAHTATTPLVTAGDVMRPPLTTADSNDNAAAAAYLMKHTRATALMVVDAQAGQPKGILTEADIVHAVADGKDLNEVRIRELMTIRPTVINPSTTVGDAARIKLGPDGAILAQGLRRHQITPHAGIDVVDTTAAGDALAGAYVAARLAGRVPADAADLGVAVAFEVIRWPGAIAPRERFTVPLPT